MATLPGEFDDFEIHINADRGDGIYPVNVVESAAGQAQGEFVLPMSEQQLEAGLERIGGLDTDEALLTDFGTRLFAALFKDAIHTCYAESVGMASGRKGLRIRLRITAPGLTRLPWELLYDPEKREFLSLSKRALITRYPHVARPPSPLKTELPLRLLIVIASPQDLPKLDGEAEVTRIEAALATPVEDHLIHYDVVRKTTTHALRDALLQPYHILHFIGHGDFSEGVGNLAFEDQHGNANLVDGRVLGTLLKNTSVRLVVLNACQSAQSASSAQAFTGVGPALVEAGIPAVVAMQFAMPDESALSFAQDFYGMLSRFLPVDECVTRAREGLVLREGMGAVDWAIPALFLRAPDGVIFAPKGVEQVTAEELAKVQRVYLGDLTTARQRPPKAGAESPQQKEIIRHLWAILDSPVYRRWAEPHEALSRWVAPYEDGCSDELSRQEIATVVEDEPVTVILGEEGMGKTAALEWLAFLFADRALRSDTDAFIPVFVKMSQYEGENTLFPLVRVALQRHGQINLSSDENDPQTQQLLAERRFVLLISGLHQIPGDAARRAQGVAALDRFLQDYPQHKYVITCSTTFYEDHLQIGKAWMILPHSDQDVQAYFTRRLGKARGNELYQGLPESIRALARVPLLLSLLLDELRSRGGQAAARRGLLLAHFASRMLSQVEASLPVETLQAFLGRLAYEMKRDQTQEYALDQTLQVIGMQIGKARLWRTAPQDILDNLLASGLLRTGSTARVAFSHPWFQEYFVATALREEWTGQQIDWETWVGESRWREVVIILVSLVEQPDAVIRQVLAHDPLLAAECLLEAGPVDEALQRQVGEALAEREKLGSKKTQESATNLLTELQRADLVGDVASYRQVVDALIEESQAGPTALALAVRGHLKVPHGPLAGLRFPLLDGTVCLGRGRQANITLRDDSVSRRHAEIKVEGKIFQVRDLGTTNGTRVNGRQITSWRQIGDGDEILLGNLALILSVRET